MDCRLLNTGVTLTKKIRENIVNYTRTHQPLFQTSLDEPLGKDTIIVNSSKTDFKVPNIVHYIWYAQKPLPLRFDKVLSVLSAVKHLKPEAIYFHTNMEPVGKYYQMLKNISMFQVSISRFQLLSFSLILLTEYYLCAKSLFVKI